MAWIESHQSLGRHPKLLKLAFRLNVCKAQAVGHLHFLWWWALEYSPNGDLSALNAQELAMACEWHGNPQDLSKTLKECGFLESNGHLHDWQQYAGPCLMARERQRTYRKKRLALRYGDVTDTITATTTIPNLTLPNLTKPIKEGERFQRPTPQEVKEYAQSINCVLDGEHFCDYYESKGWRIGNAPMKSWKAAVRTWKKRGGGALGQAKLQTELTGGYQSTKKPII